ncbi:MAG: pilus assembly protein PilM [Opitutales bacterium]|nr:pilus assembly protein PilM [Opitutales bacterium]
MSQKQKLIINCGTTQVSAGLFSVSGGSLVLESFDLRDLEYDYGMPEAWLSALSAALRSMKLSGKADVIVPTASILTKTVTVPSISGMSEAKRAEIVKFEAGKNIPYDLSEIVCGYQIIADDGIESEILLASIKSSHADDICMAVSMAGVKPVSLQPSSILDFNAWKICGLDENSMILNIGAKASNLIIARSGAEFFVRSIPVAGNAITQSVSDNLGKSFMQAESIKRKIFADEGRANDAVSDIIKNAVITVSKRLSTEIRRSHISYKRGGSETPKKLYLTGRGSLTPGLAEYLCEELKCDVQFFDVVSSLRISPSVNSALLTDASVHLSELVGEAAKMLLPDGVSINLLPRQIIEDAAFKRKMPMLFLAAAILAASVVPPFLAYQNNIELNGAKYKTFSAKIAPLAKSAQDLAQKKRQAEALSLKIKDLDELAKSKSNWINLFAEFEHRLFNSKDVWLDDLKVIRTKMPDGKPDYRLQFSGRMLLRDVEADKPYDSTASIKKLNDLVEKLGQSSFIERIIDVNTTPDASNQRILKFNFTSIVKPDKPI